MPDNPNYANNSQLYMVSEDEFEFETLEHENGRATVIRFRLDNPRYFAGDVLLVLSGSDVRFHGLIGRIEDGWATATDRRDSLLPATVQ